MQRYLQRIEKIMSTPKKGSTRYRPSKSPLTCKTNNLDQYLKYELSTKIIQNILNRHDQHCFTYFFSTLKTA